MNLKLNDRVKIKNTRSMRTGTIVGIYEEDYYMENNEKERVLFASVGDLKVKLDGYKIETFITYSPSEIKLISE